MCSSTVICGIESRDTSSNGAHKEDIVTPTRQAFHTTTIYKSLSYYDLQWRLRHNSKCTLVKVIAGGGQKFAGISKSHNRHFGRSGLFQVIIYHMSLSCFLINLKFSHPPHTFPPWKIICQTIYSSSVTVLPYSGDTDEPLSFRL